LLKTDIKAMGADESKPLALVQDIENAVARNKFLSRKIFKKGGPPNLITFLRITHFICRRI